MNNFRKLQVWQESMDFAVNVYELTDPFPKEEKYGLISQLRRCAVSVPSNISEGAGRNSKQQFKQFLGYANASSYELETQLELCIRLKLAQKDIVSRLIEKLQIIQKMIYRLMQSLK